jgi:hypothetical protein
MPNILFITTQYRAGERIYPIIPYLSKQYDLDLLKIYHMHPTKGKWGGNIDGRKTFDATYKSFFKNIFSEVGNIPFEKYDLIIADDCRLQSGIGEVYQKRQCLMVSNSHGNNRFNYPVINYQKCFDGCFVFGKKESVHPHLIPGGIPSNDQLITYKNIEKKHILIITNFLGNVSSYTDPWGFKFLPMDQAFFNKLKLKKLQKKYNKPIVIKIKSREDGDYQNDINYLHNILPKDLDYKILADVKNDNKLIAESVAVIGHGSTMMLKPLQLNIPTVIIKNYGYTDQENCLYKDCSAVVDLDSFQINKALDTQDYSIFISNTVEGGQKFNSIFYYLNYINQIING